MRAALVAPTAKEPGQGLEPPAQVVRDPPGCAMTLAADAGEEPPRGAPAQVPYIPAATIKTRVTIITGYLGAGKTTLLNHILHNKGNKLFAVVENEFGEINVDNSLVAANLLAKEDVVSLDNGCACCSLRKDIVRVLAELDRRAIERGRRFDTIFMETTGLADPRPIAFTFFANPWIAARFKLDAIVCVMDCAFAIKHLNMFTNRFPPEETTEAVNEAVSQVALADLVLLNKRDLLHGKEELETVRRITLEINPTASFLECQLNTPEGRPDADTILSVDSFSLQKALEIDSSFLESGSESDGELSLSDGGEGNEPITGAKRAQPKERKSRKKVLEREPKRRKKLMHDTLGIGSVGITARGPLHEWRFNMFMKDFFAEKARDIIRSKGVLCIKGYEDKKFVFQGVHDNIVFGPSPDGWCEGEERISRIVFIGKNLSRRGLTDALRSCVWVPLPDGWREEMDEESREPVYIHESGMRQYNIPDYAPPHLEATEFISTRQPRVLLPPSPGGEE